VSLKLDMLLPRVRTSRSCRFWSTFTAAAGTATTGRRATSRWARWWLPAITWGHGGISPQSGCHLACPNPRLQGGHSLAARPCEAVQFRPRPHRRVGRFGRRAPRQYARHFRRPEGIGRPKRNARPIFASLVRGRCLRPIDLPNMRPEEQKVYGMMNRLLGGPVAEKMEAAKSASPITYVSRGVPPFMLIHGDRDMQVPFGQSEAFCAALRAAGGEWRCCGWRAAGTTPGSPKPRARCRHFSTSTFAACRSRFRPCRLCRSKNEPSAKGQAHFSAFGRPK